MKRWKLLGIVVLSIAALSLAACSGGSGASSSSATTSGSAAASSSAASSQATVGAEDVVTISLDYNAGTGYEWQYTVEPEGVVSLVDRSTEDLAKDRAVTGGPLQDHFTFRAMKPGEVVVTFDLVRSWENGEPAESQVYAFTVTDDLKMILNPYKSTFQNEPEWGSNS